MKRSPATWHVRQCLAESAGTAVIVFAGLSAVALVFGARSPIARHAPYPPVGRLMVASVFAGAGAATVYSRLGQLSGGHFNPAATVAFYRLGKVERRDLGAYVVAQVAGALAGAAVAWLAWGGLARSVHDGATVPGPNGPWVAFGAEVVVAFILFSVVLWFVGHTSIARWTPLAAGIVAIVFVVVEAPVSGTSINPARSLGPALVSGTWTSFWIYAMAPFAGAILAAAIYRVVARNRSMPCAKLYHTDRYRCHFIDCAYEAARAGAEEGGTT